MIVSPLFSFPLDQTFGFLIQADPCDVDPETPPHHYHAGGRGSCVVCFPPHAVAQAVRVLVLVVLLQKKLPKYNIFVVTLYIISAFDLYVLF